MSICQVPENQPLCQMFARLHRIRVEQGETYRAKAYQNAISAIQNYPEPITSGEMARHIHGIGERMASRIDEFLSTGRLVELDGPLLPPAEVGTEVELEFDPGWVEEQAKQAILSLFQTIHGVGPKTALKWYQRGYRQIEDIPLEEMTSAQRLGVEFREELALRIPRAEVDLIDEHIQATLSPDRIVHQICGSYLRGRPDCGDVDILLIAQPGVEVLSIILTCPIFTHTLSHGQKKFMGIGQLPGINPETGLAYLHRRIDVEVVQPDEYPFALLYFTGPGTFNVKLRAHFEEMGYRLNEKSLTDSEGNRYPAHSEADIFEMAGVQYLTPEERDKY